MSSLFLSHPYAAFLSFLLQKVQCSSWGEKSESWGRKQRLVVHRDGWQASEHTPPASSLS